MYLTAKPTLRASWSGPRSLDAALKSLVATKLLKSSVAQQLLDEKGALGTFARARTLPIASVLVKKEHYQDLRSVGEIRNQFAHKHLQLAFERPNSSRALRQTTNGE